MSAIQPTSGLTASRRELARGSGIALAISGVILAIAVLPAEYGIDPTGIGGILGFTARAAAAPEPGATLAAEPVATPGSATIAASQKSGYRADTRQITLPPGKGLEIKTSLEKGAALIYSWKTEGGAVVNHDFHGEPAGSDGDVFESFIKEAGVSESRGVLIAPFTGEHGWFWGNKTDSPVVVTLNASGFYADIFEK